MARRSPSKDTTKDILTALKQLLANTYLLAIQTQGAHWNITGRGFPGLHKLFQDQYGELAAAIDVIAERIRALGEFAPASLGEFLELAVSKEIRGRGGFTESDIEYLVTQHLDNAELAQYLGQITGKDITTQNLAADRIEAHEKAAWMLSATLEN